MGRPGVPLSADETITLPAAPSSAAVARRFVEAIVAPSGLEGLVDAALLCVSELVSNVSLHTSSAECRLTVRAGPEDLVIEVADECASGPVMGSQPSGSEHGRGLRIVDALAQEWGVRSLPPGGGKAVWLRLPYGIP